MNPTWMNEQAASRLTIKVVVNDYNTVPCGKDSCGAIQVKVDCVHELDFTTLIHSLM